MKTSMLGMCYLPVCFCMIPHRVPQIIKVTDNVGYCVLGLNGEILWVKILHVHILTSGHGEIRLNHFKLLPHWIDIVFLGVGERRLLMENCNKNSCLALDPACYPLKFKPR